MADAAAQAAAAAAANRRLNETISDLPKFYGTSKDTITAENLIDRIDSSIGALAWSQNMAFEFFRMALHSEAEEWIKLVRETNAEFATTWDFIKPLFKARFGKRMDVAKVGTVLENLKMAEPTEQPMKFAARLNSAFSQLREMIPRGQIVNIPQDPAQRTDAVCEGIHDNAIRYLHLQYLKYFYIAGLPKYIMQLVATKDPATFTEAHDEANRIFELNKVNQHAAHALNNPVEDNINQIRGNGSQNPYRGNYRGRGGRGRGAPRGGQPGRGGYNNGGQTKPSGPGDNQAQNQNKPTCWYCSIPGHRQEDCRKRIREGKPCIGLNGSTYWPKPKQSPINEGQEGQGGEDVQGAIGEMYTGQLASVFSGFQ